jgi:hypothetical protein
VKTREVIESFLITWNVRCWVLSTESFCLGTIVFTLAQKFLPWHKSLCFGTKVSTLVQKFLPRYRIFYLGSKVTSLVQKFLPWDKRFYIDTKVYIYLGTKVCICVQNFIPGFVFGNSLDPLAMCRIFLSCLPRNH